MEFNQPIDRRSFLLGAVSLALSQLASGCQSQNRPTLAIQILKNSLPPSLVGKFQQSINRSAQLKFTSIAQLADSFNLLQEWQKTAPPNPPAANQSNPLKLPLGGSQPPSIPDLVMLGDAWLAKAIEWQLIQPIDPMRLSRWSSLSTQPLWQNLVKRNARGQLDLKGQTWGVPYRWGSTVLAYRIDRFKQLGWTPTDWSDLWNPQLQGSISLPDHARATIGLTLKKLGYSYNTQNVDRVPKLAEHLQTLHQQTKLYSSDAYLQPLLLKDTWLAVASSADILNLPQYGREIAAVVPRSGTCLWADLWVRPVKSPANPSSETALWEQWIDFCWQPHIASQLSLLSKGVSPIFTGTPLYEIPETLQTDPVLLPTSYVLQKSEFINPLTAAAIEQYRKLWTQMRNG
jgi:putative spermidine/putrescine transport system substrate-binding protein